MQYFRLKRLGQSIQEWSTPKLTYSSILVISNICDSVMFTLIIPILAGSNYSVLPTHSGIGLYTYNVHCTQSHINPFHLTLIFSLHNHFVTTQHNCDQYTTVLRQLELFTYRCACVRFVVEIFLTISVISLKAIVPGISERQNFPGVIA